MGKSEIERMRDMGLISTGSIFKMSKSEARRLGVQMEGDAEISRDYGATVGLRGAIKPGEINEAEHQEPGVAGIFGKNKAWGPSIGRDHLNNSVTRRVWPKESRIGNVQTVVDRPTGAGVARVRAASANEYWPGHWYSGGHAVPDAMRVQIVARDKPATKGPRT